jgi:predicted RND superfamily exporter protein
MPNLTAVLEGVLLDRPRLTLVAVLAVCSVLGYFTTGFKLDASADSLLLEKDGDLRYYRAIRARYGSDDYLIVTWTSPDGLFRDTAIDGIRSLRDELRAVPGVASVTTMLDVPLIASPRVTLNQLQDEVPTLLSPRTDRELARRELTESSLYRQLIMSADGKTTALLVSFRLDPEYLALIRERDLLREKGLASGLSPAEGREVDRLSLLIAERREVVTARQRADIAMIRQILDRYRDQAELRLGGLPMIVADMLDYILKDVVVFGAGILVFLVGLLSTIFIRPRWVILSLGSSLLSVVFMIGLLGLLRWPVTVVSANFVALLLIFSLSLSVHLIVRYRELHSQNPSASQRWLVSRTIRDKFQPCFYTVATTMVAFASLLVSDIRPVIDFGWMMVIGMAVVLAMAFVVFPAGLMLVAPGVPQRQRDLTGAITGLFARAIASWPRATMAVFGAIAVISAFGVTALKVENRFIDNFKDTTDIYQGLVTIDRELGGTTPLDVVLDADPAFFEDPAPMDDAEPAGSADDEFGDEFAEEFGAEPGADDGDLESTSYWYNTFRMETIAQVHDYLESLPETGKVLSMATTIDTLQVINDDETPGTFFLSILYKRLPDDVKAALFDPYMSADGNQVRFSVRVFESDPNLRRAALLARIRQHLVEDMGFKPEQVHLSGMLVLYNNVLQSLFRSQILTMGFVFLAILGMFLVLFRSLPVAVVTLVPNLLAAGAVLGLMGLTGTPLDIMTITIAAITVGIGVDDSIHYAHRFREELRRDGDYRAAVQRSHGSIGRAMYYTSIIIAAGFSILVLSNFIPTIYFGLFTGFAMLFAMVANLTLLPLLLLWLKPFGAGPAAGGPAACKGAGLG